MAVSYLRILLSPAPMGDPFSYTALAPTRQVNHLSVLIQNSTRLVAQEYSGKTRQLGHGL